ncbi:MAG: DUF4493 domain-containing protein [Bacteroidaceae bacterium]|nr:DUF4493 domain-containing protein [Bacteroidaceae bacterium]
MEKNNTINNLKFLLLMAAVVFTACQTEEVPPVTESAKTGCIVLSVPEVEVYTESGTRGEANGSIDDYTYTLNSVEGSVNEASNVPVIFDNNGTAIIPAGKYTLTATSKTAQDEAPWYQGTSNSFTLGVGGTQSVSINLDKPKNAEIAVAFQTSFTTLYENYSVTIGTKSVSANGNLYAMPGEITYTIKGTAKAGSHVSDIPAEGVEGTIIVAAGTSYPLNISAQAISDLLIEFGGTHDGEFDTKEYRPLN